jgi:hypothetical protein
VFTDKRVHIIEKLVAFTTNCPERHWRKSAREASLIENLYGMREGVSEVEERTAEALAQLQFGRNIGEERGEREVPALAAASIAPENTRGGSKQNVQPQRSAKRAATSQQQPAVTEPDGSGAVGTGTGIYCFLMMVLPAGAPRQLQTDFHRKKRECERCGKCHSVFLGSTPSQL